MRRRGFSLVELLVVIGIIALLIAAIDEDVAWLEIAVDEVELVRSLERSEDSASIRERARHGQRSVAVEQRGQRLAVDELEAQVVVALDAATEVVELDDVWMMNPRRRID